jgi:hypothetical protein
MEYNSDCVFASIQFEGTLVDLKPHWTAIRSFSKTSSSFCQPIIHTAMMEINTVQATMDLQVAMHVSLMPSVIFILR